MKKSHIILIALSAILLIPATILLPRSFRRWNLYRALDQECVEWIPARRGNIYDCDGNLIATSRLVYDIHLDCQMIESPEVWKEKTLALAPKLAALLPERTAAEWWEYLQYGRQYDNRYLKIAKDVSPAMRDSIARLPIFNMPSLKGGAIYTSCQQRSHPYDSLARRVIGYVRPGDNGHIGVEGYYDYYLRGADGSKTIRSGWYKGERRHLVTGYTEPKNGADAKLTLSMPLQALADSALRVGIGDDLDIASGCVVMMDVKTGAIRAMVNLSRGKMSYETSRLWERYNDAIAHSYEPGEVVQTMTLASVLRDGNLNSLNTKIPTRHGILSNMPQDIHLKDYERQFKTDSISVLDAFALSSRYAMAYMASGAYDKTRDYYTEGLRNFCLPKETVIGIEGLREVDITNPNGYYWEDFTLPSMANGHGLTMVPLDILSFYNTIANKGCMVRPHLLEAIYSKTDTLVVHRRYTEVLREEVFSAQVADSLTRALLAVTESGTGTRLRDTRYTVAGKTGTARQIVHTRFDEKGRLIDPYHDEQGRFQTAATYAGFFPADDPKYSIICVLYSVPCRKTYYGGTLPALIVKDIVNGI